MPKTAEATRLVADADVLAAELFIDGPAREVLDLIRTHTWLELVASERLLTETTEVIRRLGDASLAAMWRAEIEPTVTLVDHPSRDHPALASAYAAEAAHLLTYDTQLTSTSTGVAMRRAMPISVRTPDAFLAVVDIASLYEATFDEEYPGPDAAIQD